MKNTIIFILLTISISAFSQSKDSLSISTETVEKFEKVKLLDAYEKAFGKTEKWALRAGLGGNALNGLYSQIEFKLNPKLSIRYQISTKGYIQNNIGLKYFIKNPSVNFIGKYWMLDFGASKYFKNLEPKINFYDSKIVIIPKKSIELKYGKQFSNLMDFGISLGLNQINRPNFNEDYTIKDYKNTFTTLSISSYSYLGIGINSLKRNKSIENCEFYQCFSETNRLTKLNLKDLFYINPKTQFINTGIEKELRLFKSFSSINFGANVIFFNNNTHSLEGKIGKNQDLILPENLLSNLPAEQIFRIYSKKTSNNLNLATTISAEIRNYLFQKRRILKGISAKNFNGFYIAGKISNTNFQSNKLFEKKLENSIFLVKSYNYMTPIFSFGWQKAFLSKYFYNIYFDRPLTHKNNQQKSLSFKLGYLLK